MNKITFVAPILIVSAVLLSACTAPQTTPTQMGGESTAAEDKKGDTTLTGMLTQKGGVFFLERPGETPQTIESYSIDLASYINQNVTIVGQFSGDTLFAGTIQPTTTK